MLNKDEIITIGAFHLTSATLAYIISSLFDIQLQWEEMMLASVADVKWNASCVSCWKVISLSSFWSNNVTLLPREHKSHFLDTTNAHFYQWRLILKLLQLTLHLFLVLKIRKKIRKLNQDLSYNKLIYKMGKRYILFNWTVFFLYNSSFFFFFPYWKKKKGWTVRVV